MELLDVFDDNFAKLSEPASIDDVHKLGLWHQTCACWLVHRGRKTVFLQLRGPRNRIDPGSYDATSSGHLSSGETPEQGFRELEEELGLDLRSVTRHYAGIYRNVARRGSYLNREFCHVFLVFVDERKDAFTLQDGEVQGVFECGLEDALDLFRKRVSSVAIRKMKSLSSFDGEVETLTVEKMCNWQDRVDVSHYYQKVIMAAMDYLSGEEPDLIVI